MWNNERNLRGKSSGAELRFDLFALRHEKAILFIGTDAGRHMQICENMSTWLKRQATAVPKEINNIFRMASLRKEKKANQM